MNFHFQQKKIKKIRIYTQIADKFTVHLFCLYTILYLDYTYNNTSVTQNKKKINKLGIQVIS